MNPLHTASTIRGDKPLLLMNSQRPRKHAIRRSEDYVSGLIGAYDGTPYCCAIPFLQLAYRQEGRIVLSPDYGDFIDIYRTSRTDNFALWNYIICGEYAFIRDRKL
jgi:hypothetical protein